jgi:anti-anti-sigma regulatory factor
MPTRAYQIEATSDRALVNIISNDPLSPEVVAGVAELLKRELRARRSVTLDLNALPPSHLPGIPGVIITLRRIAAEEGQRIRVTGVSGELEEIFKICGVDKLIESAR